MNVKRNFFNLLGLLGLALLGTSCQSMVSQRVWEKMTANMDQKSATVKQQHYGSARTVQVLAGNLRKQEVSMGMASVISPDGYALTAAHVVDELPITILRPRQAPSPSEGNVGELRDKQAFVGKLGSSARVELKNVKSHANTRLIRTPARVVRRFRDIDLALIKLPVNTPEWFPLAKEMPSEAQPLYVTRNPVNHGGPSTIEGAVQSPERIGKANNRGWWVDSNVPVIPGDSGGPAFDSQGQLVGCVALGNVWRLFSGETRKSGKRWTSVMGVDPAEIQRTIQQDRQRMQKNLQKLASSPSLKQEVERIRVNMRNKPSEEVVMGMLMEAKDKSGGFYW